MARTCIICGNATGSREHVFPAALGGRRTNKGIYCDRHNNEYSPLASVLVEQLDLFNAQLGVVGDHATEPRPAGMTDLVTGRKIYLTNTKVEFEAPQIISQDDDGERSSVTMTFANQKQADAWVEEQKAKGVPVEITSQGKKERYYSGTAHRQLKLGGPEGLRAIGYVAQTFLAHHFPDVARLPELSFFKEYTLRGAEGEFVWWDFESPDVLPPNAFAFGHRIVVGLNEKDRTAYARISLFSTLDFAVLFGSGPVGASSQCIIVDVDPLANAPPKDIVEQRDTSAKGAVVRPASLTASLSAAIHGGMAESRMRDLLRRLENYNRKLAAAAIMAKLVGAERLDENAQQILFLSVVDAESQRVLRLMNYFVDGLKKSDSSRAMVQLTPQLDALVALDPASSNGLTKTAIQSLGLARAALAARMIADFSRGALDQDRVGMLIGGGGGAGVEIVGRAIMEPILARLPPD
jgi:hypothetical protein